VFWLLRLIHSGRNTAGLADATTLHWDRQKLAGHALQVDRARTGCGKMVRS